MGIAPQPDFEAMQNADINMVVGGTKEAITMVEGGANEASEADMLDIFDLAHDAIKTLCAAMDSLREKCGVEKLGSATRIECRCRRIHERKWPRPASQSTFNLK